MRAESVEGFVLHARDYRETSQLVDIFTATHGRVRVVARGSRSHKKNTFRLSPFTPANFSWTGRGDLKTLTQFEAQKPLGLVAEYLICGFYLNELLWHLLQPEDSHPELYISYQNTLLALAEKEDLEPLLRRFELNLLEEVGYGISFELDTMGEPIDSGQCYTLAPQQGWTCANNGESDAVLGQIILNISQNNFGDEVIQKACKKINRSLLDFLLEGRKLNSRELISQSQAQQS